MGLPAQETVVEDTEREKDHQPNEKEHFHKNDTRFQKVMKSLLRNWQLYILLLPAVTYFFIFHYIPMYGVQIAFKDYFANLGYLGSPWVGFEHFERFFNSYYFDRMLSYTLILY